MIESAIDYAKICNAVYSGVHATRAAAASKVACGVTAPRGNNAPGSHAASVVAARVPDGGEGGRR